MDQEKTGSEAGYIPPSNEPRALGRTQQQVRHISGVVEGLMALNGETSCLLHRR